VETGKRAQHFRHIPTLQRCPSVISSIISQLRCAFSIIRSTAPQSTSGDTTSSAAGGSNNEFSEDFEGFSDEDFYANK
jgi:hypothetical protein